MLSRVSLLNRGKVLVLAAAVVAALALAPSAQATEINGAIGFGGEATPTGGSTWATATGIAFVNPAVVASSSGVYASVPHLLSSPPVTFTNFTFSPTLSPSPVNPLWTFTFNSVMYSFQLTSAFIVDQGVDANGQSFLTLGGAGILMAGGFTNTPGTFAFSSQGTGAGNFSFSASNLALPDAGSTMLLFGTGLAAIAGARRRWRRGA